MPLAAPTACSAPGCRGRSVDRGNCAAHRRTTSQRGYGGPHQRERRAALPGARCEACGCTKQLQRDHRRPRSLAGREEPANKRWLCDCAEHRCHHRLGVKSSSRSR